MVFCRGGERSSGKKKISRGWALPLVHAPALPTQPHRRGLGRSARRCGGSTRRNKQAAALSEHAESALRRGLSLLFSPAGGGGGPQPLLAPTVRLHFSLSLHAPPHTTHPLVHVRDHGGRARGHGAHGAAGGGAAGRGSDGLGRNRRHHSGRHGLGCVCVWGGGRVGDEGARRGDRQAAGWAREGVKTWE